MEQQNPHQQSVLETNQVNNEKPEIVEEECPWESGKLGQDPEFARVAPNQEELRKDVNDALNLDEYILRVDRDDNAYLKELAAKEGLIPQAYIRKLIEDHLNRERYVKREIEVMNAQTSVPLQTFLRASHVIDSANLCEEWGHVYCLANIHSLEGWVGKTKGTPARSIVPLHLLNVELGSK